jgi:hypothetical protein
MPAAQVRPENGLEARGGRHGRLQVDYVLVVITVYAVAVTTMDRRCMIVAATDMRMRTRERHQQDADVQSRAKDGEQGTHGGPSLLSTRA